MAFTIILRVTNNSSYIAQLRNYESWGDTNNGKGDIPAGAVDHAFNGENGTYVPWATNADEWGYHRITVVLVDAQGVLWKAFAIWQRGIKNGEDLVRCSQTGARWEDPGAPIGGMADVGGWRRLVVGQDGALSLEVYERPRDRDRQGHQQLWFRQVPGNPLKFIAKPVDLEPDAVVDRIHNTALAENDEGFTVELRLADRDGNAVLAGPAVLAPDDVLYGDFAGKPAGGQWSARPINILRPMVRNPFKMDLYWRR
jgi:hypothetical protein